MTMMPPVYQLFWKKKTVLLSGGTNPERGTALGFANRPKDAVLGANINLDIQNDADDEELTIQHREYGVTQGFWITSSKDGVLTDDELEPELFHGQDIKGTIEG
ncbi:MAG: hypothetical protein CM1200mP30_22990 [Pseudomonadota bacterium]|nr:MAG: hypothetical protein CM1200mP30_22990 [Pseudomonadota bacterium]